MTAGLSVWLDGLRAAAAIAVFVGHLLTNVHWWGTPPSGVSFQNDAVIVFFVVSGTVIAYSAERARQAAGFGPYIRARLSRLWSVSVPGVILTLLLDYIGSGIDRSAYLAPWQGLDTALGAAIVATPFLGEMRHWSVILGSNHPFWSLSYEFGYYVLFGLLLHSRGMGRWVLLGLAAWFIGHRILLLAPIWIAGVVAWRLREHVAAHWGKWLIIGSVVAYALAVATGLDSWLGAWDERGFLRDRWLGESRDLLWKYFLGGLVFLHVLGAIAMRDQMGPGPMALPVKWMASRSFSLYVFHYPLLCFFGAVLAMPAPGWLRCCVLGTLTLVSVAILARWTEDRRRKWQELLDRAWRFAGRPAAAIMRLR